MQGDIANYHRVQHTVRKSKYSSLDWTPVMNGDLYRCSYIQRTQFGSYLCTHV